MRSVRSPFLRAGMLVLAGAVAMPVLPVLPVGPLGATPALARPAPDGFADLAERLLPAVVNVSTSTMVTTRNNLPELPGLPPGSPFEQFFKDFMDRNRPPGARPAPRGDNPKRDAPERRMQSLGSGFIIDPSGLIVTNNHVIDGADEITVTLHDNTKLKATLVGRDERVDVALLKVKSDKPLPFVPFADSSKARVGDWVVAIGNPFGLGGTVTAGIISALQRDIRSGPYDDFIQTDASINQGNSGGPLFNMDGQVVGINTAIYSRSGGSIGIGFAIPANLAKHVIDQLRDFGHARRGWLGVRIQQVTPDIAESLGLKEASGAMIAGVDEKGPAKKAKIRPGDVILRFNNQDVKEMRHLPRIVAETPIGKEVPVTIWRDGKEITLSVVIGELPDEPSKTASEQGKPSDEVKPVALDGLGVKIAPIDAAARDKFQLEDDQKGVVITDVDPDSTAASRGLKPGDVIVEVQQEAVNSPADVQKRLETLRKQKNRKSVLLLIQGKDARHWVPLPLTDEGHSKSEPG